MNDQTPLQRAIAIAGGQTELASLIGVTQGAISQWVRGVRHIPIRRAADIEEKLRGQVTARELRPDFPWPGAEAAAA